MTISDAVHDRLVLEYPTIYVFYQSSSNTLPDGYLTERQLYELSAKEKLETMYEGEIVEDVEEYDNHGREDTGPVHLDEKKLLEVLGKDINER